ncbi:MAG: hydrogenase expression protein [Deltaproteobacteria bacterium]|nr:hydrogenase expression protein [Deltaproteobacteria bacterium]MBW2069657.1 hydrogenase expression protein [Deltaproteobacteria bacterium]
MTSQTLPAGKLRAETLDELLQHTSSDPNILLGPAIGEDAAVVDFHGRYLVVSTDPITFATDQCGWYAVWVNANDIAACGGTPRYFSASVVLPHGPTSLDDIKKLFMEIEQACQQLGILWIGGHTEISPTVTTPLVAGQMIGEVAPEELCRSADAQPGDALVLVKTAAIEATAIIAREKARQVTAAFGRETTERCQRFLFEPGISIVAQAAMARGFAVHAMHDPTEGGVITAIREICLASRCGVVVDEKAIQILPETAALCRHFNIDPLGAISSGALLLTLAEENAARLLSHYQKHTVPAAVIGTMVPRENGMTLRKQDGKITPLPLFDVDEIVKLFA